MSPHCVLPASAEAGFPRVSGDEPEVGGDAGFLCEFSPRERG